MDIINKPKKEIIKENQTHENDCGSSEIQLVLLTKRILELSEHIKKNPKDKHSEKGLTDLVSKRKKVSKYLKSKNKYAPLAEKLGLRK